MAEIAGAEFVPGFSNRQPCTCHAAGVTEQGDDPVATGAEFRSAKRHVLFDAYRAAHRLSPIHWPAAASGSRVPSE